MRATSRHCAISLRTPLTAQEGVEPSPVQERPPSQVQEPDTPMASDHAQAQAQAQAAPMPSTFFAQNGRPSQQSPFLMAQAASYPSMRDGYPFAGAGSQTMVSS